MKKNLKTFIFISSLILFLGFLVLFLVKDQYLYGSSKDFISQHFLFPQYFRELFYDTKDLFPDFMLNLGSGQNIYNISYYGLYNPVYMISYLLPMVPMVYFIMFVSLLAVISSSILMYFYLKRYGYNEYICFLGAFILLCATPLTFHSHRHIMFMNYMPFIIMGLFGVDKYLKDNKMTLLVISLSLIIYSNYFFSVSALCSLLLYGVYKYFCVNDFNFKNCRLVVYKLFKPFFLSVLIGSLILLPTMYVLLNNRPSSNNLINIIDLLKLENSFFYKPYGMGLTGISFMFLLYCIYKSKLVNKLYAIGILLLSFIPIFNLILNGFIYLNGKALIPFIPVTVFLIVEGINLFLINKSKYIKIVVSLIVVVSSSYICIDINNNDEFIIKDEFNDINNSYNGTLKKIVNIDNSFYRVNTLDQNQYYINNVSNINIYKSTLYSSTYNTKYQDFYNETIDNNVTFRNKFFINSGSNILSQLFFSEKYIVSSNNPGSEYESTDIDNVYLLKEVLPLGYATNNYININDFEELSGIDKSINIIGNIVNKEETSAKIKHSNKIDDYKLVSTNNVEIIENEDGYKINSKDEGSLIIESESINDELVFISFKVKPQNKDLSIAINDIDNKLTDTGWKYYNDNEEFNYVISDGSRLEINFSKGDFEISDIQFYSFSYDELVNYDIDPMIVDTDKTNGDVINGSINVKNDSYFTMSIPYDDGFKIYVDDTLVNYEMVNDIFIGFPIDSGYHDIFIEYHAPFKDISMFLSGLGFLILFGNLIYERRNKK